MSRLGSRGISREYMADLVSVMEAAIARKTTVKAEAAKRGIDAATLRRHLQIYCGLRPNTLKRGLPPELEPRIHSERDAEIVRLRRDEGVSYEALGIRFKISRERIRQVICRLAPELIGPENCTAPKERKLAPRHPCKQCGAPTIIHQAFCNRTCRSVYSTAQWIRLWGHDLQRVYDARKAGLTWVEACAASGLPHDQKSVFLIHRRMARWCSVTGAATDRIFGPARNRESYDRRSSRMQTGQSA